MIKNLDGIKKLTPDELKKSREIVLNFIGEKDEESNFEIKNAVDSINRISFDKIEQQDIVANEIKKVDGITKVEKSRLKDDVNIINQEAQKLVEEKKYQQQLEEKQEMQKQAEYEKIKFQEEKAKKDKESEYKHKKEEEEKKEQEKRKKIKQLENKKILLENKEILKEALKQQKQLKKQAQRINFKKRINQFKKNLKHKSLLFLRFLRTRFKKILVGLIMLFLLLIIFYIIFCEIVLGFGIDNKLVRQVGKYLFVPALISDEGFVDYFSYKDEFVNKINIWGDSINIRAIVKDELLKNLLCKNLAKKYGIIPIGENWMFELEKKVIIDKEINQNNLARITKINSLVKEGKSFFEVKKYGDEFELEINMEDNLAQEKFGRLIKFLSIGQVSDILVGDRGYYLVKKNAQSDNLINITYIFIKAETLDNYINNEFANLKAISLID